MRSVTVLCLFVFYFATVSHGYLHVGGHKPRILEFFGDVGEPLFLSPLIKANKIQEAQRAAKVNLTGADIESYSGFLTVNELFKSNLFFWFFKSKNCAETDPVILWLQGGPGGSSLFGLFEENGPFTVNDKLELVSREHAWTNNHSVLYIDNPVGTGFSLTGNQHGYADNQTQVGKELYSALVQFFKLFPELQKNEFFITGESYAGKYIPAIAYTILKNNPSAELKINLQGLAIGNGLSDPETQQTQYGALLYEIGLIDINLRRKYEHLESNRKSNLNEIHFFEYLFVSIPSFMCFPIGPFFSKKVIIIIGIELELHQPENGFFRFIIFDASYCGIIYSGKNLFMKISEDIPNRVTVFYIH